MSTVYIKNINVGQNVHVWFVIQIELQVTGFTFIDFKTKNFTVNSRLQLLHKYIN